MKFFENRKVRGAISIFLVIITIPTLLFSAVLVDGSRMASARAMTQEAADLAAISVLADYNLDLKESYGLFSMEDSDEAEEIYRESLEATLLASGISGAEDYSEELWNILKDAAGVGSSYDGENFLNLYDFSVESCSVTPCYSLAEWQVLENQMVEHAKFRGIFVMADRLGLLKDLGSAQGEAAQYQEAAGAMEDKMDVDEKNMSTDKALSELRGTMEKLNGAVGSAFAGRDSYRAALQAKMKEIRLEYVETDEELTESERQDAKHYEDRRKELKRAASTLIDLAKEVLADAGKAKNEAEKAIERLEKFQSENSAKASGNSGIEELVNDAEENIEQYRSVYIPQIDSILNDPVLNRLASDSGLPSRLEQKMEGIDEAIRRYGPELEELEEESDSDEESDEESEESEEDTEEEVLYYYYYLNSEEKTEDVSAVLDGASQSRCYMASLDGEMAYFKGGYWKPINPTMDMVSDGGSEKISRGDAEALSGQTQEIPDESSAERGEVPQEIYNIRPSKYFESEGDAPAPGNFYNESGDLSASKDLLHQGAQGSMVQRVGEVLRDDVLCMSYMFGTFKTRLTGVERLSGSKMSASDKNSFYMPDWRKNSADGELDMRFEPKKNRDTVLRGEIEYLICGNRTDAANENTIYALIFAERMANNMYAVYTSKEVKNTCKLAASAASLFTGGFVPPSVFLWIFITAWATAETFVDMNYLMQGYKIPLLKGKNNLVLDSITNMNPKIERYGKKGVFVAYEDYLMIMLLLAGRETRLMRSADLIEMNMRQSQPDFAMAKAYTYIHARTEMSTRYLFNGIMPFQEHYEAGQATGRMRFANEIYLGY